MNIKLEKVRRASLMGMLILFWTFYTSGATSPGFVAISAEDGAAAYTFDGINWTPSPGLSSCYFGQWQSVTYGAGTFAAIASITYCATSAYSTDGVNWTNSGLPSPWDAQTVVFGNGVFVVPGWKDDDASYSTDGINWSTTSMPFATWAAAAYGSGVFVAVAGPGDKGFAYSTDGITWATTTMPFEDEFQAAAYGNGVFVVIANGDASAAYSSDGVSWTGSTTAMPVSDNWQSVAFGNGIFVAIANGDANAAFSTDGISWTSVSMPVSDSWSSITFGNGMFMAITGGTNAAYSYDGKTWMLTTLPFSDTWVSVTAGEIDIASGCLVGGLDAYWKLNDGSGCTAADSSTNGFALSLVNSPAWATDAHGNNYLTLDGSTQYGDAGDTAGEFIYQDMTVSAWVKKSANSYKAVVDKSFDYGSGDLGGWGLRVRDDGHLEFWGGAVEGQSCIDAGPATNVPGEWTFLTVVWHASTYYADFYINGIINDKVFNNQVEPTATQYSGTQYAALQVGDLESNLTYALDGSMHDVAIYGRALSPAEVGYNFLNSEFNTNVWIPELLYYKMSEAPGISLPIDLADSSTHGGTTGTYPANSSTIWTNGVTGKPLTTLHFDGATSYIDTGNSDLFDFTNNLFTINLWVDPTGSYNHYLMQNCDSGMNNGWYLYVTASYQASFGTITNGLITSNTTPTGAIGSEGWNMVTIVRTAVANTSIYINGVLAVSGDLPSASSSSSSLKFGIDPTGANFYDGNIWIPQIWNKPLSQRDIANLYLNQVQGRAWP